MYIETGKALLRTGLIALMVTGSIGYTDAAYADRENREEQGLFSFSAREISSLWAPLLKKDRVIKDYRAVLDPYKAAIRRASREFNIPVEIISAVIIQESGGNAKAKAKGTSAKGLMQTIDATFDLARRNLQKRDITIIDPYDPEDSIFAGAWYLHHCASLAGIPDRSDPQSWGKALEYYYVGPELGARDSSVVKVFRNGIKTYVNKQRYADMVLARSDSV